MLRPPYDMKVKGMIFAAGVGSRLRPITDIIPKALVDVGGIPMLQRTIMRMREAGITDLVVNVHHHASKIIDFLAENDNFGLNITVSDESDTLLDTGGGLLKAAPLLGDADAVVLHNADIFTDIPLSLLIDRLESDCTDVVLAVNHRTTSRYLLIDGSQRMVGWTNTATGEVRPRSLDAGVISSLKRVGFCGIHVIRQSSVMERLRGYAGHNGEKFSLTPFYIDNTGSLDIHCEIMPEGVHWVDIGRHESLALACSLASEHS